MDPLLQHGISAPKKLLSIIGHARNDGYLGNFTNRLSSVLNKHANNITILGLESEVEVIVTDWGSNTPLWQALELSNEARSLTKFLIVPPELATVYDKDAVYAGCIPPNSAARRAQGKYCLYSDSDGYIPVESMARMVFHLRNGFLGGLSVDKSFFWATKYHVPYDFVVQNPSLKEIDEHILAHWRSYQCERVSKEAFGGCGVCILLPRSMWHDSTGWDEKLIYWGWNDIDWHMRLVTKFGWDDLDLHQMHMFHLEHYKDRFTNCSSVHKRKANAQEPPTTYAPNPTNWGLADHTLSFVDGFGRLLT